MPRTATPLTALKVQTAEPGRYGDGGGLYLLVRPGGTRFWLFRYLANGKMREMGLGAAVGKSAVSLADARAKASKLNDVVQAGRDPLAERDAAAAKPAHEQKVRALTFPDDENYLAAHKRLALRDMEELRTMQIKSNLNAIQQRYERSKGNPLYVWEAVRMCCQPGEEIIPLPRWCTDYLFEAAENLSLLSSGEDFRPLRGTGGAPAAASKRLRTTRQMVDLVPQALGFSRRGSSVFKEFIGDADKITAKIEFDRQRFSGSKYDESVEAASKTGFQSREFDTTKKAITAGGKLLMHAPSGSSFSISELAKPRSRRTPAPKRGKN